MSEFEQNLREALARREPPEGFTERVMGRTRFAHHSRFVHQSWMGRVGNWAAAVAVAALLVGGAWFDSHQSRRVRGERAKEEVLLAFRITGATLRSVRQQVLQIRTQPD